MGVDRQQQKQTLRANLPSLLATEIPFERFIFIGFVKEYAFTGVGRCISRLCKLFCGIRKRAYLRANMHEHATISIRAASTRQGKRSYSTRASLSVCVGGEGCRVWYNTRAESIADIAELFNSMQQMLMLQKIGHSTTNECCCTVVACTRL